MTGFIVIAITWAVFYVFHQILKQYSKKNQDSFSEGKRKLISALLIAFAAIVTFFQSINPIMETILQPPDISPYNYEEVYEPPVEIEMRIHGALLSRWIPFLNIYYTTDGSDPSNSDSAIKYDGPFYIQESTSFSARCQAFGLFWGDLLTPSPYYKVVSKTENFVAVEKILAKGPTSMYVGESAMMSATVLPENATDKKVYWSSSNTSIATVDRLSGKVVAIAVSKDPIDIVAKTNSGQQFATIKLTIQEPPGSSSGTTGSSGNNAGTSGTLPGEMDEIYLLPPIILEKTLDSIEISPDEISILEGTTIPLNLIFHPSGVDAGYVEWKSHNDNIARVSIDGYVTGVKEGTTQITATVENHSATAYIEVQSAIIEVSGINVSEHSYTLQSYGSGVYANAWVLPVNADDQRLRWYSENEEIVQVDSDGFLIPCSPGITTVHVADWSGRYSRPIEVEVIPSWDPPSISIDPSTPTISPSIPIDPSTTTIAPSINVTVNRSSVAENDFVDVSFDLTTPDYYSEVWIVYVAHPNTSTFIQLGDGPLFTYHKYTEVWKSIHICPQDYKLLPGTYTFYVYLGELNAYDEYGRSIVFASDSFQIEVY